MGIQPEVAAFVEAMGLPKGFSVCELGDQGMCGGEKRLAKDWYEELGCGRYVSIDGNGRGTLAHDLNLPINPPIDLFDLVTDFGTGEHIFDQAQVWRTLHSLAKLGAYIAFDRPASGYETHCYYLTHMALYEDIVKANDYGVLWLQRASTKRGVLIRGVFQKMSTAPFKVPQQGRYQKDLVIP